MIPKPDAQSYTRFLTTVGVFLCIAALVAPGLILRETAVLRVSSEELSGLTNDARKEIERRQHLARTVGILAPYGGAVLLASGLVMIALAIPRLRKQEGVSDQLTAADLRKALAPQDPAEREARLARVVQMQVESADRQIGDGADRGEEPLEPDTRLAPSADESSTHDERRAREAIGRLAAAGFTRAQDLELRLLRRLAEIQPKVYDLRLQVTLEDAGHNDQLTLDALLFTNVEQLPDVVIEIEVYVATGAIDALPTASRRALGTTKRYMRRTGRDAITWLIVVDDESVHDHDDVVGRVGQLDPDALVVSVLTSSEIDDLHLPHRVLEPA